MILIFIYSLNHFEIAKLLSKEKYYIVFKTFFGSPLPVYFIAVLQLLWFYLPQFPVFLITIGTTDRPMLVSVWGLAASNFASLRWSLLAQI